MLVRLIVFEFFFCFSYAIFSDANFMVCFDSPEYYTFASKGWLGIYLKIYEDNHAEPNWSADRGSVLTCALDPCLPNVAWQMAQFVDSWYTP